MASGDQPPGMTPAGRPRTDEPAGGEGERARLRVLEALRRSPSGLGVRELAVQVGLHVNTVRFHLDRLLAEGQVQRAAERRDRPGRPRLTFTAVPGPQLLGGRRDYRVLAELLTDLVAGFGPEAARRARSVGRRWGAFLARKPPEPPGADEARRELLRVLDEVGFAPQPDGEPSRLLLRHCPFLEAAELHPEVVCAMHRGLMDGALDEIGAPLATERLVPFAEPGGCVARLSARRAG